MKESRSCQTESQRVLSRQEEVSKKKKKKAINTVSNALLGSQREKIKEGTLVLDGI